MNILWSQNTRMELWTKNHMGKVGEISTDKDIGGIYDIGRVEWGKVWTSLDQNIFGAKMIQ